MKTYFKDNQTALYLGDCVEVMARMKENFVDAIVTDPPYGLEFMGKEWDKLNEGKIGNPNLMPDGTRNYQFDGRDNVGGRLSRRASPSTPRKNPRCRKCGRLKFAPPRVGCNCDNPNWDTRMSEYGQDMQHWHQAWAEQALRVLKPGGHMLVAGIGRTMHRMMCGIEDAGFEPRDCIFHTFGSGFPKSLAIGKAIDKLKGVEREVVGSYRVTGNALTPTKMKGGTYVTGAPNSPAGDLSITAPATPEAQQWDGWGTSLKPAWEIWVLFRKPLSEKNVAENVLRWGTGGINVDASRVRAAEGEVISGRIDYVNEHEGWDRPWKADTELVRARGQAAYDRANAMGRYPANFILSHSPECTDDICAEDCPIRLLDLQSGERPSSKGTRPRGVDNTVYGQHRDTPFESYGDTGGASRFYKTFPGDDVRFRYQSKASRSEREEGLLGVIPCTKCGDLKTKTHVIDGRESNCIRNDHPTVKPVKLMEYLIRLITPSGGVVLDPFAGSGSTGVAAKELGVRAVLIEKEENSIKISLARLMPEAES